MTVVSVFCLDDLREQREDDVKKAVVKEARGADLMLVGGQLLQWRGLRLHACCVFILF
jgi:hypothetical protein